MTTVKFHPQDLSPVWTTAALRRGGGAGIGHSGGQLKRNDNSWPPPAPSPTCANWPAQFPRSSAPTGTYPDAAPSRAVTPRGMSGPGPTGSGVGGSAELRDAQQRGHSHQDGDRADTGSLPGRPATSGCVGEGSPDHEATDQAAEVALPGDMRDHHGEHEVDADPGRDASDVAMDLDRDDQQGAHQTEDRSGGTEGGGVLPGEPQHGGAAREPGEQVDGQEAQPSHGQLELGAEHPERQHV